MTRGPRVRRAGSLGNQEAPLVVSRQSTGEALGAERWARRSYDVSYRPLDLPQP